MDTTRRYPRSIQQAFGPHCERNTLHPMPQPRPREGWFVLACAICLVLGLFATYGG